MQLFFKPTTTKMLGNLKVFTIALLLRVVMRRRFNIIQVWMRVCIIAYHIHRCMCMMWTDLNRIHLDAGEEVLVLTSPSDLTPLSSPFMYDSVGGLIPAGGGDNHQPAQELPHSRCGRGCHPLDLCGVMHPGDNHGAQCRLGG